MVPLHLVACCLGKRDEFGIGPKRHENPSGTIVVPTSPLETFLGLSRVRGDWSEKNIRITTQDYWNWIDLATIGCAWARGLPSRAPRCLGRRLSADLAVATSMLMWVRFCWYLKNMRLGWAKFVLMFEDIVWDLRYYLFYFLVVPPDVRERVLFVSWWPAQESDEFGFHDDGAPSAFGTFLYLYDPVI